MTAKERIVKSQTGKMVMERHIDDIYEDSNIMCSYVETCGQAEDELIENLKDVFAQAIINTSTWGLKYWSEEYGVKIPPGSNYVDVRRIINEKRRYVAPPNEYNLEKYVENQTGIPCSIIQWTGPYKFSVEFYTQDSDIPFSYSKAYKAVKDARQAHLCFDIIPTARHQWSIESEKVLIKFMNPMTGMPGLRAGMWPHPLNIGRLIQRSIVVEPAGKNYRTANVFTGTRPDPAEYGFHYHDDYVFDDAQRDYEYFNIPAGILPLESEDKTED